MTGRARIGKSPSPAAFKVALLLCCGISASALAASNPVVICDDIPQDMQGLGIPVKSLPLRIVDHSLAVAPADLNESLESADAELHVVAPVLSLTPRVATLLDKIFAIDSPQLDSTKLQSSSPLAERVTDRSELQNEDEVTGPGIQQTAADKGIELPKIPQQMFRKDI